MRAAPRRKMHLPKRSTPCRELSQAEIETWAAEHGLSVPEPMTVDHHDDRVGRKAPKGGAKSATPLMRDRDHQSTDVDRDLDTKGKP